MLVYMVEIVTSIAFSLLATFQYHIPRGKIRQRLHTRQSVVAEINPFHEIAHHTFRGKASKELYFQLLRQNCTNSRDHIQRVTGLHHRCKHELLLYFFSYRMRLYTTRRYCLIYAAIEPRVLPDRMSAKMAVMIAINLIIPTYVLISFGNLLPQVNILYVQFMRCVAHLGNQRFSLHIDYLHIFSLECRTKCNFHLLSPNFADEHYRQPCHHRSPQGTPPIFLLFEIYAVAFDLISYFTD